MFSRSVRTGAGNGKYQAVGARRMVRVPSAPAVTAGFLSSPVWRTCLSLLDFRMMLCTVTVRSDSRRVAGESHILAAQPWILVSLQGATATLPSALFLASPSGFLSLVLDV